MERRSSIIFSLLMLLVSLVLNLAACGGGGGDGGGDGTPTLNVSQYRGTWVNSANPSDSHSERIDFVQIGSNVSGTVTAPIGTVPFTHGTVLGSTFTFGAFATGAGGTLRIDASATISGDKLINGISTFYYSSYGTYKYNFTADIYSGTPLTPVI